MRSRHCRKSGAWTGVCVRPPHVRLILSGLLTDCTFPSALALQWSEIEQTCIGEDQAAAEQAARLRGNPSVKSVNADLIYAVNEGCVLCFAFDTALRTALAC